MSDTGHTPGPWSYNTDGLDLQVTEDGDRAIPFKTCYITASTGGDEICTLDLDNTDNTKSNALLIAAAPDMLETLEEVKNYLEHEFKDLAFYPEIYKVVDRVIDKAKGTPS